MFKIAVFISYIIFALSTVAGAIYVLYTGGMASTWLFIFLPLILTLTFGVAHKANKQAKQPK